MRTIAIEEHFRTPGIKAATSSGEWSNTLRRLGPQALRHGSEVLRKLDDLGAERLADMDAAGIDMQILSHTYPSVETLDAAAAIPLARDANDALAEVVARHPDRFCGFATLPTPDPNAAAAELERTVATLGFKGALINGRTHNRFMDDQFFWPIFERAEDLDVPIYLHPGLPPAAVREEYYENLSPAISRWLSTAAWGWHIETGLHALRLIVAGVFDRFLRLRCIIGHMGEAVPFMLGRIDMCLTQEVTKLEHAVKDYFVENFYITTSGFFAHPPLVCALQVVGADRVMFSVDYPYSTNEEGQTFINAAPVTPLDRDKIAHGNAERLLRL
ncbi:MAG TPA: amidohydrolase family protein [bacterium]|nr:amidohydrolase family protein [bacterium]